MHAVKICILTDAVQFWLMQFKLVFFRDQMYFLPGPDGKSEPFLACAFSAWWPSVFSVKLLTRELMCPSSSGPPKPLVHTLFWPLLSHDHSPADNRLIIVVSDCDPMDCSLPGSSVHGIFQARGLEWIAISFFRGSLNCCLLLWQVDSSPLNHLEIPAYHDKR